MAYLYMQYEIGEHPNYEKPFYIGVSNTDVIQDTPYSGQTPEEIIENFVNTPYIRMLDFGPKSPHGMKAKLHYEDAGEKSAEYQEFIKDKKYKFDYDAKVLFESNDLEHIYFFEFLTVAKYGLQKDGGLLFNKIAGGHTLINGKAKPLFGMKWFTDDFMRGSATCNPNYFIRKNGYYLGKEHLTQNGVYSQNTVDGLRREIATLKQPISQQSIKRLSELQAESIWLEHEPALELVDELQTQLGKINEEFQYNQELLEYALYENSELQGQILTLQEQIEELKQYDSQYQSASLNMLRPDINQNDLDTTENVENLIKIDLVVQ